MKLHIKKHLFIYGVITILAIIIIASVILGQKTGEEYETMQVKKIDLTQEVEVTGKVRPTQERLLAFERSGKVANVKFSVGENITAGQRIASLDTSEMQAQLRQSEATIAQEENILAELQRGSRVEELVIARTAVSNAERTRDDPEISFNNTSEKAKADLISAYSGAFTSAQSSVVSAKNALVVISEIQQTRFTEQGINASALSTAKSVAIEELFDVGNTGGWTAVFVSDLSSGIFQEVQDIQINIATEQNEEERINVLLQVQEALFATSDALDAIPILSTFTTTEKADLSAQETTVSAAITALSAKLQIIDVQKAANTSALASALAGVTTAENALQQAKNELILKEAGNTPETLALQMSRVVAARAAKELIQAQINTMTLKSPIDGIITKQELHEGVFVQAGSHVVSVISKDSYEVEIFVPEVDIAKITIDDSVNITLDAYTDDDIFLAQVASIDPAETIIEGVATYKVTVSFIDSKDERIKPGMTADTVIFTDEREQVLAAPTRAIITEDSQKYVRMPNGNEIKKIPVETGMKSSSGYIEITDGLKEGETIITFIRK